MKSQEVVVVVNDIKSNGIISLEKNVILIDMGITKQVIDFRDISIYDKKSKTTLGLILKNNKSIDLIFKDYLLLYKLIDDFMKSQAKNIDVENIRCPECETINKVGSFECSNCGFPFRKREKNKKEKSSYEKKHMILLPLIIVLAICSTLCMTYYTYTEIIKNKNNGEDKTKEKTGKHYCLQDDGTVILCDELDTNNTTEQSDDSLVNEIMNNRKEAKHIFSITEDYLTDYIILGYKNKNYRCNGVLGPVNDCFEINYQKNGEKVKISYVYNSNTVEFDCKETSDELICYMEDGITEYGRFKKEK